MVGKNRDGRSAPLCSRVLVTGGAGFVGSHVCDALLACDCEVTIFDAFLDFTRAESLLPNGPVARAAPAAHDRVRVLRGDLRDRRAVHEALKRSRPDAVVHLAALCNDPLGNLNPDLTLAVNHRATVTLGRAAKAAGVTRFLFASSCSLYGAGPDGIPLDESAPFAPLTPYGESKILAERGLAELADDHFSPVFLRNATAYGFSPRLRGDLVVNDLVGHALFTGKVRLLSDGSAWRPLVHVEDIAAAFCALLEVSRERVHARAFNIGQTAENYRIREVAQIVGDLVGGPVTMAPGAVADRRDYRVSCEAVAREIPEFRPQWTVAKGVEQLAEAYQRYDLTLATLIGERHQRVRRILSLLDSARLDEQLRWVERPAWT